MTLLLLGMLIATWPLVLAAIDDKRDPDYGPTKIYTTLDH